MKKSMLAIGCLLMCSTLTTLAQGDKTPWISNVKLSGYGIAQYQASNQNENGSNTFNIRLFRLALDGRFLTDFYWKAQVQLNGNTSTLGSSPRIVDVFAEWQKYREARIKMGQFKRPFTFDNPLHPIDQGFYSVAQSVSKFAGFSGRVGEHPSNGRDIGLQVEGDIVKTSSGRPLFHYQVGVFNGQGTNMADVDQRKDLIGGVWVMPVTGMRIGVFGWNGSYARKGTWKDDTGMIQSGVRSLPQHKYALSMDYVVNDWTVRTEYIHATGNAFKQVLTGSSTTDCTLSPSGNKSDGYYAALIAPVIKKKLYAKVRYDLYRPAAEWSTARTVYEVGAHVDLMKKLRISAEYMWVNDRSLPHPNYDMIDLETSFRF